MFWPQNTLFDQNILKTKCDVTNFGKHVQTTKKLKSEMSAMILIYHLKSIKQLSFDDFFKIYVLHYIFKLYIVTL